MPDLIRPLCLLAIAPGRFAAETTRFIARAFTTGSPRANLHPFAVISCVTEGSAGTPLCVMGRDLVRAKPAVFPPL